MGQAAGVVAAIVLAGLVLAAGMTARSGMWGAAALAAVSVLWLLVNGPMEGPILVTVSAGHGLTGADLAGFTGLGLAVVRFSAVRRSRASVEP